MGVMFRIEQVGNWVIDASVSKMKRARTLQAKLRDIAGSVSDQGNNSSHNPLAGGEAFAFD